MEIPHKTIREFNAQEAYTHLKGLACCVMCSEPLGTSAWDLDIPLQKIDETWYEGSGAEFCSEAHALQYLKTLSLKPTTLEDEQRLPTQITNDVWVHAYHAQSTYPVETPRSGKWLIWLSVQTIDRYWAEIKKALQEGKLGFSVKASTAGSRKVQEGRPYVVCVYTYDSDDKSDVFRVRAALRDLGIRREIIYKCDEDTVRLRYGKNYEPLYRA